SLGRAPDTVNNRADVGQQTVLASRRDIEAGCAAHGRGEAGMAKHYASGSWHVTAGKDAAFLEPWTKFLNWTKQNQDGFGNARILHDEENPQHYQSFAEWRDAAAREAWRNHPEFMGMFTACRELCDDFSSYSFEESATV